MAGWLGRLLGRSTVASRRLTCRNWRPMRLRRMRPLVSYPQTPTNVDQHRNSDSAKTEGTTVAQSLASAAEHNPLSNSAARADTDPRRGSLARRARGRGEGDQRRDPRVQGEVHQGRSRASSSPTGTRSTGSSQLEVEDRDELLETLREGFAALGIGGSVDWVDAAQARSRAAPMAPRQPNEAARAWGRSDGLGGAHDHAGDYPSGEPGHGGLHAGPGRWRSRARSGDGAGQRRRGTEAAPRGRPRKQQQEAEADAEF